MQWLQKKLKDKQRVNGLNQYQGSFIVKAPQDSFPKSSEMESEVPNEHLNNTPIIQCGEVDGKEFTERAQVYKAIAYWKKNLFLLISVKIGR